MGQSLGIKMESVSNFENSRTLSKTRLVFFCLKISGFSPGNGYTSNSSTNGMSCFTHVYVPVVDLKSQTKTHAGAFGYHGVMTMHGAANLFSLVIYY